MSGRSPKFEEERLRRAPPARGEWTDLPAVNTATPPKMPEPPRGGWSTGTKLAWVAWWSDPVSLVWTPSDVEGLRQLTYLHHDLETSELRGKASLAAEVRQRMDGLGLTQKGKRDFRWRIVPDETDAKRETKTKKSRYERLRAVPSAVEGS